MKPHVEILLPIRSQ